MGKPAMIDAICKELKIRSSFFTGETIKTIYFGGGTPSILKVEEIALLLTAVYTNFTVCREAEITLEANPDDLTEKYLKELKKIGVNRLSIGSQSFNDKELKMLNRRHTSGQTINSVKWAQKTGFDNISLDIIYGLPGSSPQDLVHTLKTTTNLDIQHISAYHLTIEPQTVLYRFKAQQKINEIEEKESLAQYLALLQCLENEKFVQYEVSSFAREGRVSKHNTNYWKQKKYLGVGPSAHSYNLTHRQWNVSDNKRYMNGVQEGKLVYFEEKLSVNDNFNDYIMLGLRTRWGINLQYIKKCFGIKYYKHTIEKIEKQQEKFISAKPGNWSLTAQSLFISDAIISEIFII